MKRSNYASLLQKLTGRTDVKSFYFKEQKVALTINGWLRKSKDFQWIPINESDKDVILIRLRNRLGTYRFQKNDTESFKGRYKENMALAMKVFSCEQHSRRMFNHVHGELDLDKIRAILRYQALEPDNTYKCKVNNQYDITMIGNFNNDKFIPCIETKHLVQIGDTVSNKFSLGRVHGYTDVTTL